MFGAAGLPTNMVDYNAERENSQPGDRFYPFRDTTKIPTSGDPNNPLYGDLLRGRNAFTEAYHQMFEDFPEEIRDPWIESWIGDNYPDWQPNGQGSFPYQDFVYDGNKLEERNRNQITGTPRIIRTDHFNRGENSNAMSDNFVIADEDDNILRKVQTRTPLGTLFGDTRLVQSAWNPDRDVFRPINN